MLVKMAEFVLTNNYFEFGQRVFHQISGTAIGTKFTPPYACIFMDKLRQVFLKRRNCIHLFGLGIYMMYSLYGVMVKTNFKIL